MGTGLVGRGLLFCCVTLAVCGFSAGPAAQAGGLKQADNTRRATTLLLHTHTRLELVDDEGNNLDAATALTHRSYVGVETAPLADLSLRVAFENVLHLIDDFNVPGERSRGHDVVADPEGTELEEAFLAYTGVRNTTIKAGRQYLSYRPAPMHRFIGTVPWRQNWQSMDALSVQHAVGALKLNYAFVANVNRIFGDDNPRRELANSKMKSHLLNVQYGGSALGAIEGFYYRLDYDDNGLEAPFSDRDTLGIKLEGARPLSDSLSVNYLGEFAHQRAIEDNHSGFDSANQYRVELGLSSNARHGSWRDVNAQLGYEVLESDGGASFATPLATVHAFQGWADRLIGFPGAGVEDRYLSGGVTGPWAIKMVAIYHDFSFNAGGGDYGEEIDVQATKRIGKVTLSFKHASYFGSGEERAGPLGKDKSVSWFFVDYKL